MKSFIHTNWFKKTAIIATSTIAIVTPIVLLSINWNNLIIIYSAGSSAVAPLLMDIASTYSKFNLGNNIEVNVLATGSGNGLESIVNNTKNLGNVSWGPDKSKIKNTNELPALDAWTNDKIKTFTLAIDGIGVIYKPDPNINFDLDINQLNIEKLYEAVAGVNSYSYGSLIGNNAVTTTIVPYARTGGASKSGTTDAFLKDSGFKIDKNAQYYKNLSNGQYGSSVEATRESNVETWKQISSNGGRVGALTYLSAGFILNNITEIQNNGFKVASYNGTPLSLDQVTVKYKWYRPLNILFSIKNATSAVEEWVQWLYTNYLDSRIQSAIINFGGVPLSKEQLNTMTIKGEIMVSDFEIKPYDSANDEYKWGAQLAPITVNKER